MTKPDDAFDDQALGSFVDDLLDAAHAEKIIRAMENDPEIRECVYLLRRMSVRFGNNRPGYFLIVRASPATPPLLYRSCAGPAVFDVLQVPSPPHRP